MRRVAYYSIYAALALDEPADIERELRAGLEALQVVGERTNYCTLAAQLAHALCDQGQFAEAERYTRASEEAARLNDVMANVLWRSARARALAARGDLPAAEGLAAQAVAFAAHGNFLNSHADALVYQAEVLKRAGRPAEAHAALEQAVALYERKGNVVAAARAQPAALDIHP